MEEHLALLDVGYGTQPLPFLSSRAKVDEDTETALNGTSIIGVPHITKTETKIRRRYFETAQSL